MNKLDLRKALRDLSIQLERRATRLIAKGELLKYNRVMLRLHEIKLLIVYLHSNKIESKYLVGYLSKDFIVEANYLTYSMYEYIERVHIAKTVKSTTQIYAIIDSEKVPSSVIPAFHNKHILCSKTIFENIPQHSLN
jgi:hypothetical protein